MELEEYKAIIEGLLFASGEDGITIQKLSTLLNMDKKNLQELLGKMRMEYKEVRRGITIMDSNGTLHLTTKPEHAHYYKQLMESPGSTRLSQAALETLAIVAYQQPITRVEIDDLRGVKSDRPIQTLVDRDLVIEKGRKDAIGRPVLFGTTKEFLTYFGLTSLEELPPLADLKEQEGIEEEADLFFEKFTEANPLDVEEPNN